MCLYINRHYHKCKNGTPKPFTAKKRIYVWKVFSRVFDEVAFSHCKVFKYERNNLYELDGNMCVVTIFFNKYRVFDGIHAYRTRVRAEEYYSPALKCYIPKGAKYYIGMYGEIVADKMFIS